MQHSTLPDLGTPYISVAPGTVLGHRKDDRPIYVIAGGSGEGEGGGSEGGQGNEGGNQDTGQGSAAQQGGQGGNDNQDSDRWLDDLPDDARKEILRLRRENAANRVKVKDGETEHTAQLQKVLKALGLDTDGDDNTDKLNEKLTAAQTDAKQRAVELAVYKAATKAGADPDALLDSRAFLKTVSALDHTGDSFEKDVLREVREAAKTPKYRSAPARSGGDFGGSDSAGDRVAKAEPGRSRLAAYYADK
ncbi:hypothetical protein AB0L66_11520 [Streptomyces sp. NPDC052207]|uniref:hypothetical protein n=1 Tax=Streptomyces sp. NPDC052207 TaxID=3155418 RepID=UPI00344A543E